MVWLQPLRALGGSSLMNRLPGATRACNQTGSLALSAARASSLGWTCLHHSAALHAVTNLLASLSTSLTQMPRASPLRETRLLHLNAPHIATPWDACTSLGHPAHLHSTE